MCTTNKVCRIIAIANQKGGVGKTTTTSNLGIGLTDTQVKSLLEGKKILMKGLKSKNGKTYDAYLIPEGIEDFSYMKDGKEIKGTQYKIKMEFPQRKKFTKIQLQISLTDNPIFDS